jgi:hypothetical protein
MCELTPKMREIVDWWKEYGIRNWETDDVRPLWSGLMCRLDKLPTHDKSPAPRGRERRLETGQPPSYRFEGHRSLIAGGCTSSDIAARSTVLSGVGAPSTP